MASRPETSKSTVESTTNPFSHPSDSFSPPQTPTSASRSSLRSSFTLPTRNSSTKTSLIKSRPTSRSDPSPPPSNSFDDWDTSSVAGTLRDSIQSHIRAVAAAGGIGGGTPTRISTRLAPIPGSRPASPAKTLDGPFLPPSPRATLEHTASLDSTTISPTSPITNPPAELSRTPRTSPPSSPTYTRLAHTLRDPAHSLHRASSASSSLTSLPRPNPPFAGGGAQGSSTPTSASPTPSFTSATPTFTASNAPTPTPGFSTPPPYAHHYPALPRTYSTTSLADSVSHLQMKGGDGLAEENVHPLFRSCSPAPPPGASNATVVVAASIGDALGVTSTEDLRGRAERGEGGGRSRAGSRAGSVVGAAGARSRAPSVGASVVGSPLAEVEGWGSRASSMRRGEEGR